MEQLQHIFDKLNLTKERGLFLFKENQWKGLFTSRVERLIEDVIQPDAFFCIDNKPFILFFNDLEKKGEKLKQIWNFNESPIVFVVNGDSLEIYNGFEFLETTETLDLIGGHDVINDFTYFELVTGETWKDYQRNFSYKNRVDYRLLENIKSSREILTSQNIDKPLSERTANALLGKVIFTRYLIDREVRLDFEQKGSRTWSNDEFCSLLSDKEQTIRFFTYLKNKFNGNLFPLTEDELSSIPQESFSVIIDLLSGNEVPSGQISLFNFYDFSIIPVEFISNVYELFIGKDQQESKGAYYTPLFLVDYILSETVGAKFQERTSSHSCRVLDPSCGSGIFLVESLRKIIERFQANNPQIKTDSKKYKNALKELATENIFGVDKDESAVDVAIFSIYLTLLDYQKPSDIETFRFPELLGKNFFPSDDFFDEEALFNQVFEGIEFDFILGNPPWKRGKGGKSKPLFVQYINDRSKKEKATGSIPAEISNSEIAQAFTLRVSDFCKPKTRIGLIATSKILYNLNGKGFRKYFLDKFHIDKVFELAPVRKEVFDKSQDKAIAPAVVLFYRFAFQGSTDRNIVEHITLKPNRFFSLFKVFTIQRGDYKKITQSKLKAFDYLWKILVYGSYLDFNLINRLKNQYTTIKKLVKSEGYLVGQGIIIGQKDRNDDVSELIGRPMLNTRTDVKPFWVNKRPMAIWSESKVHRSRPESRNLFEKTVLLITEGLNKYFKSVSAIHEGGAVFKSSLTGITSDNVELLKSITGILNSSLFSYFSLNTFSSTGIEREQSHDEEKLSAPFILDAKIYNLVSEIMQLKSNQSDVPIPILQKPVSNNIIDKKLKELDRVIFESFALSKQEICLMDYANNVTIPLIMKHKGAEKLLKPLKFKDEIINDYASLFFERFNEVYELMGQKLIVEVRHSRHIIGLFFKVVSLSDGKEMVSWVRSNDDKMLQFLTSIGTSKITDKLFVQKDVRGFEENGFYIVKPNELKLWHKAVGYLDAAEFHNAVLIAGKKSVVDVQ